MAGNVKSTSPSDKAYQERRRKGISEANKDRRIAKAEKQRGEKRKHGLRPQDQFLGSRHIIDFNRKRRVTDTYPQGLVTATKDTKAPDTRRITMRPVLDECADYVAFCQPKGAVIHRLRAGQSHVYCRA
jgi:hypothetical protein